MKTTSVGIRNIEALPQVVQALINFAGANRKFILNAEMGAGKTTFTKAFCTFMGVASETSSPTFSLVNEYIAEKKEENGKKILIRHLDLYRLKQTQEAFDIGVEDFLYDDCYLFIEWADLIMDFLPEKTIQIQIEVLGETERKFIFSYL